MSEAQRWPFKATFSIFISQKTWAPLLNHFSPSCFITILSPYIPRTFWRVIPEWTCQNPQWNPEETIKSFTAGSYVPSPCSEASQLSSQWPTEHVVIVPAPQELLLMHSGYNSNWTWWLIAYLGKLILHSFSFVLLKCSWPIRNRSACWVCIFYRYFVV